MRNKIIVALILALVTFICIGCSGYRKISRLQSELDKAQNNIIAYQESYNSVVDMSAVLRFQVYDMEQSRDSVVLKLDSIRKLLKIKDKQLKQAQSIESTTSSIDTIFIGNILVKSNECIDTTIVDDWYKLQLKLCDSLIVVNPEFKSDISVFVTERKEIIGKPKRFALFRLFQKKRTIKRYDIIEQSPYSKVTGTRFIEVTL